MRSLVGVAVLIGGALAAPQAEGAEAMVESRIESVGLFKNGLAVVKRVVVVPGPGTYVLTDAPVPVHGTLWVESNAEIETRASVREVEVPLQAGGPVDLQEALVGQTVKIQLRDGQLTPVSGTVESVAGEDGELSWNRGNHLSHGWNPYGRNGQSSSRGRFLMLKTDGGRAFVDMGMIATLHTEGASTTLRRRVPVLQFDVKKVFARPATISISYLAKGLSWSPGYRVDISDAKSLTIEQSAVIKNELGDLDDARIDLISGFPQIEFANVTSPFSVETSWTAFFQQLSGQGAFRGHASTMNAVSQQAIPYNMAPSGDGGISVLPSGEGVDVHYHSIGNRTLREGDALHLRVASGKADYERVVEWDIKDTRDAYGRPQGQRNHHGAPVELDSAWDAIRFKNPLPFPLTTAPASVVAGGRFLGQATRHWVNPAEETIQRVTKALSLRTRHREHELEGQRENVNLGGQRYRKAMVQGTLEVCNHRAEEIKLIVRRKFSGELLDSDGDPTTRLREEGAWSVNPRVAATWSLTLKPGEVKELSYRYQVLVNY